ncbi:50S ribosomal protein L22 [Longibacter sp.]|jgi:large subunit ribosomal protein L22|uniref:50S ribosomal protein L22 n=1 Tax=Longibacter sp. TaxID=2045415 RepID=UPI001D38F0CE|nr:50S ribosomal protein L22 [Bacteroidota bacterium]
MEARAIRKHIRSSPKKVRRIINLVRGKTVPEAISILDFMPQRATEPVQKTIWSAFYNLLDQEEERFNQGEVVIKEIRADEGPTFKRYQPRARGRAAPIRKHTTHLTVIVGVPEEEPAAEADVA